MVGVVKYNFAKFMAHLSTYFLKVSPTGGQSFPGLVYLRIAGNDSLKDLASKQIETGSILITGTNGKTTTTTMIIKLFSKDYDLSSSVGNNTINALATSLLKKKSKVGVFEYGIRDIKHGTPDLICDSMQPMGVVYTNISREHTQVAGVKNPFEKYVEAKTLLSKSMKDGVLITNGDDPYTAYIGKNKETDNKVMYYGLDVEDFEDIFDSGKVYCPNCQKELDYGMHYFNHRGTYSCSCGFKKPELNIKLTQYTQNEDSCDLTIEVDVYNYTRQEDVQFTLNLNLPIIGLHNIYNCLTSITAYSVFSNRDNIKETLKEFFESYEFIVPPGRFEILNVGNKTIGVGQGDNGDALKVNALFMGNVLKDKLEVIYTTPDANEEEIFEDHAYSIKALNPDKLIIMPGRKSLDAAGEYYNQLKDMYNAEYYSIEFNFQQRIDKIIDLINNSEYEYIFVSGCGEEIVFWDELKKAIKSRCDS